jgi:hypothetical protein
MLIALIVVCVAILLCEAFAPGTSMCNGVHSSIMDGDTHNSAHCASCQAPIIWTLTERGKRMPVNAEPVDGGNIRLDMRRPVHSFVVPVGEMFSEDIPGDDGLRYTSHFASCPEADLWRNGRPAPNTPGPDIHRTMHRSF